MIKRSAMAMFIDAAAGGAGTPEWSLVGKGVSDMSIAYNPQTRTEQDITEDTAQTDVTGYQPNAPVTQTAKKGDAVYDFVNELRRKRAVFEDCETDALVVDLYDGEAESGYKAEKQRVSIQVDSYGGAGADPLSIGYTINFKGDPVSGTFKPDTQTFTEDT